jgi:hypothetical protein
MNGKKSFQHSFSAITLVCLIGLAVGSSGDNSSSSSNDTPSGSPSSSDKWFQGGTLHQATMTEWKTATSQNKLATAADWLATTKWKGHLNTPEDFDEIKVKARMLVYAVDDAVPDDLGLDRMKAREIAASIIIMANDLGP